MAEGTQVVGTVPAITSERFRVFAGHRRIPFKPTACTIAGRDCAMYASGQIYREKTTTSSDLWSWKREGFAAWVGTTMKQLGEPDKEEPVKLQEFAGGALWGGLQYKFGQSKINRRNSHGIVAGDELCTCGTAAHRAARQDCQSIGLPPGEVLVQQRGAYVIPLSNGILWVEFTASPYLESVAYNSTLA